MNVEVLYYVSQIVAVIVIVATLLAILWQGYQTNKIARADLTLSMWMQAGAMNQSLVDSSEKAAFIARVFDPRATLTPEDQVRFTFQMYTQVGIFQAAFNLHNRGLIEPAAFDLCAAGMRAFLSGAFARQWWRLHRGEGYDPKFCALIDKMAEEIEREGRGENPQKDQTA
jgi:hypothetical protein